MTSINYTTEEDRVRDVDDKTPLIEGVERDDTDLDVFPDGGTRKAAFLNFLKV